MYVVLGLKGCSEIRGFDDMLIQGGAPHDGRHPEKNSPAIASESLNAERVNWPVFSHKASLRKLGCPHAHPGRCMILFRDGLRTGISQYDPYIAKP